MVDHAPRLGLRRSHEMIVIQSSLHVFEGAAAMSGVDFIEAALGPHNVHNSLHPQCRSSRNYPAVGCQHSSGSRKDQSACAVIY